MKKFTFTTALAAMLACLSFAASATIFAQTGDVRDLTNPLSSVGRDVGSTYTAPADSPQAAWVTKAPYPTTIGRYGFADAGESFYVISGVSGVIVNTVRRYDTATNAWTSLANIPTGLEATAAAIFNNKIYVGGGDTGSGTGTTTMQIYDIATNTWTTGASMPSPTWGAAAGAFNGKFYVVAGNFPATTTTRVYDIATNTWTTGTAAPSAYILGGYTQVGQYLYMVGSYGADPNSNSTVTMRLDMSAGTWQTGPTFTPARADFALASFGSKLYAIGGDAQGGTFFNPSTAVSQLDISAYPAGTWTSFSDALPSPRQGNQAGFNSAGGFWSTGGTTGGGVFIAEHLLQPQAPAVTFTVNTNFDNEANGCGVGLCTLREAITAANTNAQPDIIAFDPTFFNVARTITLNGTNITITADGAAANTTTINGPGANLLTVSGNNASRVFTLNGGVNTISGLTVSGGNGVSATLNTGFGGGIFNDTASTLNLTAVAVSGNTSSLSPTIAVSGGGIYNGGIINITNSTVSGNNSVANGGGLQNAPTGTISTLTNSTFSGNTATGNGGGIRNFTGTLNIFNCTIADNSAGGDGGGIGNPATGSTTNVRSTIVARNTDTTTANAPDAIGPFVSQGFNLIGIVGPATGFTGATDQVGTAATPINPLLNTLGFYGGTTRTHALLAGSPAIDRGNSFTLTTDQRGSPRPVDIPTVTNGAGDGADIGAYELQSATAAGVTVSGRVLTPTGKALSRAVVLVTDMQGQSRRTLTDRAGSFTFGELEAGATYIFEVRSKIYSFAPQVVTVSEDVTELNFTAQ